MMRRWIKLAVVAAGIMTGMAHAGVVVLTDGRTIEGTVTLVGGGDGKIMVQPEGKAAVRADLVNVRKAVFNHGKEYDGVRWSRTQLGSGTRAGWAEINGDQVTIRDASEGFRFAKGHRFDPAAMRPYACCFVFQKLQGDAMIMANVQPSVEGPKTTRAGVMICEGLNGTGPFVMVSRTPDQTGTAMLSRMRGEATQLTMKGEKGEEGTPGMWLRLIRKATPGKDQMEIEAFESTNAIQWTKIGEIKRLAMNEDAGIYIGVAASGHWREGAMANFSGIRMTGMRVEPEIAEMPNVYWPQVYTLLADGTVLPVEIDAMKGLGEAKLRLLANLGGAAMTVDAETLVRTQFEPLSQVQLERLNQSSAGVLTRDGDFLDGEIKQLNASTVTASSVAFGLTKIDRKNVAAIAYAPPPLSPTEQTSDLFEVRLQDGTLVVARKLRVERNQLVMDTPLFGTLKTAVKEVVGLEKREKE